MLYNNVIPYPREVVIICLLNTCDVLRFIFQLDAELEERIQAISRIDLIGRSITNAVAQNLAGPLLRRHALTKRIPTVSIRRLLLNPHLRDGNLPAVFADLAEEYGPVFQIKPPFQKKPMIWMAGAETNRWAHREGRRYLRARDYLQDFEKVYGASGILPALDGADHFRFRKATQAAYSRARLEEQVDQLYFRVREYIADWKVGDSLPAVNMCRMLINSELSPIMVSVYSQDIIEDLIKYKERALTTHVLKIMPKFMLSTPGMKRRAKAIDTLLDRIQSVHTAAQRAGMQRDLADDLLSMHMSDPQFLPESNLRFALSAALIASVYLGDGLCFAAYAMVSQPELYDKIRGEADALFGDGDPSREDFTLSALDVTHRFLMECSRLYPVVPISVRNVMNTCVVEDYEIPEGSQIFIAQSASHFMEDIFPDPFSFDIDRYLPERREHISPGYAPYGLGTHTCLGQRWAELQLTITLLMLAHYFTFKISPDDYKLRISPFPNLSPSKKLKFAITEQRREIPV